jgi:hypothetical protein
LYYCILGGEGMTVVVGLKIRPQEKYARQARNKTILTFIQIEKIISPEFASLLIFFMEIFETLCIGIFMEY